MIRKHLFKDKADNDSIRWRLHEPTRLEAFSDAVIAFAITLVAISLEVPQTFDELLHLMQGFFGFAICFLFLALIWHEQYVFFRRFGLQDTRTIAYNLMLLFMVIYLVYPLKFLFYFLAQGSAQIVKEDGTVIDRFKNGNQPCELMIIYGIGYFIIYSLMALMYKHALKKKDDIRLSRLEIYNTKTYIRAYIGRLCVVVLSLSLAIYGIDRSDKYSFFSGISYSLIGFVMWFVIGRRKKKIPKLFTKQEIEEVRNELVIVEETEA